MYDEKNVNPKGISCECFFPKPYFILDIEETKDTYEFWLMSRSDSCNVYCKLEM